MNVMYKSYKFRMYPTDEQSNLIDKNFGCKRFVYNYFLNEYKSTKKFSSYNYINILDYKLKREFPFLLDVDNSILKDAVFILSKNVARAANFGGVLKYKTKFNRNSYTIFAKYNNSQNNQMCNIEIDMKNKNIYLPGLNLVKIRGYRNLEKLTGKIKNVTISRDGNDKYYVSVMCEFPQPSLIQKPKTIVGIDVGVKKIITLSDGISFDNEKHIEKYEKRIKKCQKSLYRKQKGSNNYYKCKKKLAILYTKLTNARKFYTHKITKKITDEYDIITCENLTTKNMIEQKVMAKRLVDATLTEIIKQLEYKTKQKGKYFYQVSKYYPSSQTCSVCDNVDKKYKDISLRNYECSVCHNIIDRDLNASINIMFEGLKMYMRNNISRLNEGLEF